MKIIGINWKLLEQPNMIYPVGAAICPYLRFYEARFSRGEVIGDPKVSKDFDLFGRADEAAGG